MLLVLSRTSHKDHMCCADIVYIDLLCGHAHKPGKQSGQTLTTPRYTMTSESDMDKEYHVGDMLEVDSVQG